MLKYSTVLISCAYSVSLGYSFGVLKKDEEEIETKEFTKDPATDTWLMANATARKLFKESEEKDLREQAEKAEKALLGQPNGNNTRGKETNNESSQAAAYEAAISKRTPKNENGSKTVDANTSKALEGSGIDPKEFSKELLNAGVKPERFNSAIQGLGGSDRASLLKHLDISSKDEFVAWAEKFAKQSVKLPEM